MSGFLKIVLLPEVINLGSIPSPNEVLRYITSRGNRAFPPTTSRCQASEPGSLDLRVYDTVTEQSKKLIIPCYLSKAGDSAGINRNAAPGTDLQDLRSSRFSVQSLWTPFTMPQMKSAFYAALAALAANEVAGHATFQDLWINGVDYVGQCARLPLSNSPVTDVTSDDIRCNAGTSAVSYKCVVAAGDTVTVEMHQVWTARPLLE